MIKLITFTGLFIVSLPSLHAQLSDQYKTYQERHYKGLRYGLYTPVHYDSKKSYPLIVYLHGARDTVSRDLVWYQEAIQRSTPAFVLTPKCEEPNQGWGNTWSDTHTSAMSRTLQLVDSLVEKHNINKNRLYLYGISMGAFGVFSVLAKDQGKFAAAYAICGGANVGAAARLLSTPLWIFHGADDDIVPVRLSRGVYNEMKRLGATTVRYSEYPGVKHNSWENAAREKSLVKWFLLQQKEHHSSGAPVAIADLKAELTTEKSVTLHWNNDTNQGIWFYKIYRDRQLLAEIDGESNSYSDLLANQGVRHTYHVVSVNYFFEESKPSPHVQVD